MSENLIDYSNFQPDWWDAADVTAEAVKTEIGRLIDSTFGVGGVSDIQKLALEAAGTRLYESQQAMKAAGEAALKAISYADQPNSVLFKDALASRIAYENIAKAAADDAGQILKNTGADVALASKLATVANVLGSAINIAQLGAAAATGDAFVVGQKAVGVLAGMAFGALAVGTITAVTTAFSLATAPLLVLGGTAIVAGFAGGKVWEWMWKNGASEFYGINKGDKFNLDTIWGSIQFSVNTAFNNSRTFIQRRDPLTLDLDGDGLETVGIDPNAPILFDHDGDGVSNATGWIRPDDGFLVLDRNGDGLINNGTELFGDSTPLFDANGQVIGQAADGFAALAQQDSNADGVVNEQDANFASLRVWKDADSDGVTNEGELHTLESQGIAGLVVVKRQIAAYLDGIANALNGNKMRSLRIPMTSTVLLSGGKPYWSAAERRDTRENMSINYVEALQ